MGLTDLIEAGERDFLAQEEDFADRQLREIEQATGQRIECNIPAPEETP